MTLTRSSSRNCKMTFIIGRGFAERQILKKWKWPYLLNWVEYFDKLLRKYWYWQDRAQEIANGHFSLVEALPSSKFWKSDNGAISWTEWNIVMKFCKHIDIDKMYPMRVSNDTWDWLSFCRGSNSEKSETIAKWHLLSVEALPILKKWKWPYLWVEYFDRLLHKHWYYQDLAQEIEKCHFSSVEVLSSSKFWKSENGPISWTEWNIVMKFCIHTGILTRYSPYDCQMTFGIGRSFAEVQILKKVKINS